MLLGYGKDCRQAEPAQASTLPCDSDILPHLSCHVVSLSVLHLSCYAVSQVELVGRIFSTILVRTELTVISPDSFVIRLFKGRALELVCGWCEEAVRWSHSCTT